MRRIVKNMYFRLRGSKQFLGALQSVAGGNIGIRGAPHEKVIAPNDVDHAAVSQDAIDLFAKSADDEVAAAGSKECDEFLHGHDAGGVEVTGVFHPQNDDAEVFVL